MSSWAVPTEARGADHVAAGLLTRTQRNAFPIQIDSVCYQVGGFVQRSIEDQLLESSGNFLPLALCGLGESVRISAESLVQKANDNEGCITAARGRFGELLQEVHILLIWPS